MIIILVVARQAAHIKYNVLGYTDPQSLNVINPSIHPPTRIHPCLFFQGRVTVAAGPEGYSGGPSRYILRLGPDASQKIRMSWKSSFLL